MGLAGLLGTPANRHSLSDHCQYRMQHHEPYNADLSTRALHLAGEVGASHDSHDAQSVELLCRYAIVKAARLRQAHGF